MKKVELVKAYAFELDPKKFYVCFINFPKSGLTKEDVQNLYFPDFPARHMIFALLKEDPYNLIEIVEQPDEPTNK
jgi:hypothetical protein